MCMLSADCLRQGRQEKRKHKAHQRVHAKADATPLYSTRVDRRILVSGTEHVTRHSNREVQPHAEEPKPGEQLHRSELPHGRRHVTDGLEDLAGMTGNPTVLRLLLAKCI